MYTNKQKQRAIKRVRQIPGTNIVVTIKRIKLHLGISIDLPTQNLNDQQAKQRLAVLEALV